MDQTAQSRDVAVTSFGHVRELFNRRNVGAMLFLIGMYGIWNLWAGTNGFFLPFILRTVGSEGQAMSVTIQCVSFAAGIASIFFIFMRLVDRVDQRVLFGAGALLQVLGPNGPPRRSACRCWPPVPDGRPNGPRGQARGAGMPPGTRAGTRAGGGPVKSGSRRIVAAPAFPHWPPHARSRGTIGP